MLSRLRKSLIGSRFFPCTIHYKKIYMRSLSSVVRRWGEGGCNYQCSPCQKIEYQCGEQEGSECQLPGEDDLTTQLPLSVILSSQWCMDVIWHHSPSKTSQYYPAEECYSETIGDCDPCYGMTKLHDGRWERNGAREGERAESLFNITQSAVPFHWLKIVRTS